MDDLLCSGHVACPGCIEALSRRRVFASLGPDRVAVIPPSCLAIIAGPQPLSSLRIPVYQPALETSAASASGLRRALDARGKRDTLVVVFAGDGGTYDIGLATVSAAAERNERKRATAGAWRPNSVYLCWLDTLENAGLFAKSKNLADPVTHATGALYWGFDRRPETYIL